MKWTIVCLCLAAAFGLPAQQRPSRLFELENGLRVVLQPKDGAPVTGLVLAVRLGSAQEDPATPGLTHLLEHLMFTGADRQRSGEEKRRELHSLGAYFNAHTDPDLMTLELVLPAAHSARALEILQQTLFAPRFLPEEIARERRLIAIEAAGINDDPARAAADLAMAELFRGHPYGRPVYGAVAGPEAGVEQIAALHRRWVTPAACVLTAVGAFDPTELETQVRRVFAPLPARPLEPFVLPSLPPFSRDVTVHRRGGGRPCFVLGLRAPAFAAADRLDMQMLVHILAYGTSPLLGGLGGRRGDASLVSARYYPLLEGGALLFTVAGEGRSLNSARQALEGVLRQSRRFSYGMSDYLERDRPFALDFLGSAGKEMALDSATAGESAVETALVLARYVLLSGVRAPESSRPLEKVSAEDLRRAADRWLAGRPVVYVEMQPEKEKDKR